MRTLAAPHKKLKAAQHWILANIAGKFPTTEAAHGFVADRGIVTNATPHVNKTAVVNLDLSDFFPSVVFPGCGPCSSATATPAASPPFSPCSARNARVRP